MTVNTVLPGYVATERLEQLADAAAKRTGATKESIFESYSTGTPVGRVGTLSILDFSAARHCVPI